MSDYYDDDFENEDVDAWHQWEQDRQWQMEQDRLDWEDEENWKKRNVCRCGGDMPGMCPGPNNCPMCRDKEVEETGESDQD